MERPNFDLNDQTPPSALSADFYPDTIAYMPERPVVVVLEDESHIEKPISRNLRHQALALVKTLEDAQSTPQLPDTLLDLLTQIIKPLFSNEHHSKLTSTGRKNLVHDGLPASVNRFSSQILFDGESRPLWKNGWTSPLLRHVLRSYEGLKSPDDSARRKTLEAHFHLLVPPILHQLDDVEISYKCSGCQCLRLLCDNLHETRSEILKRSGLTDVFIDALKNDFSLLPTLTPEDESLMLLEALYPAYRSLVRARFPHHSNNDNAQQTDTDATTSDPVSAKREAAPKPTSTSTSTDTDPEHTLRTTYLTLLLRHQLLHSLHHLSTGSGTGTTISVPLSTFLISQLPALFTDLGAPSTSHLQSTLPLLRNVLLDPFGTAAPELLLATARCLQGIVRVTWARIRDRWWGEVLRGAVACWVNLCDEEADLDVKEKERDRAAKRKLSEVKTELKLLVWLLEDVVRQQVFGAVRRELVMEEPLLEGLFEGDVQDEAETAVSTSMKKKGTIQIQEL